MTSRHLLWGGAGALIIGVCPGAKIVAEAGPRRSTKRSRRLARVTARARPILWRCNSSIRSNRRVAPFAKVRMRSARLP
jgi:hypothetical protein